MVPTETSDDRPAATQQRPLLNRLGYLFWIVALYVLAQAPMPMGLHWSSVSISSVGGALSVVLGAGWAGVLLYNQRHHSPAEPDAANEPVATFVAAFVAAGLAVLTVIVLFALVPGRIALLVSGYLVFKYLRTGDDPGHSRHLLENRLGIALLTVTLLTAFFVDYTSAHVFVTGSVFAVVMILEAVVTSTSDTHPGQRTPQND